MSVESKEVKPSIEGETIEENAQSSIGDDNHDFTSDNHVSPDPSNQGADSAAADTNKKSMKKKLKDSLGGNQGDHKGKAPVETGQGSGQHNAAMHEEVGGTSKPKIQEVLKKVDISDLLTGLAVGGENKKDIASYKFWKTQPVPKFDEDTQSKEGTIKTIDPENVPKEPSPLLDGFKWVTMDLTNERELEEVYELLTGHYVEDDHAMFRFNYSVSFLDWALKSPGWTKEWHVGVRASQSGKLVAFISGIPMELRVRAKTIKCSEINFLCIHKKLRSKRLTPVLITEITRRCNTMGVWQAIYTAGVVLPTPTSTCRYFHRSLDWLKLCDVGFASLPYGSTKAKEIASYKLPTDTSIKGLRPMEAKDCSAVQSLLGRFLDKFDLAPVYTEEEVEHWFVHKSAVEQVVWAYVVEEPDTHNITDFFSFYCLNSSVIGHAKHTNVRAAYLYYYATDAAFQSGDDDSSTLKARLNALIRDALILAKRFNFDVFNALTLLDNPLFLDQQKFAPGDGHLHYYLYNYRTAPIRGGTDANDMPDKKNRSGVGVVML